MRYAFVLACWLAGCGGAQPPESQPPPISLEPRAPSSTNAPAVSAPGRGQGEQPPLRDETSEPEAAALVDAMLAAVRASDVDAWGQLLSKKRRERGADSIKRHFEAWRRDIAKLEPMLRRASFSLDDRGARLRVVFSVDGREPESLVTVSREDGQLKIDEN